MLPDKNRLRSKRDFDEILKRGKTLKGESFILKFKKKENGDSRLGFIVSKNVSKKAVVRNRIKRHCREAVKGLLLDIKNKFDAVFIALPVAANEEPVILQKKVKDLLKKTGALKQ